MYYLYFCIIAFVFFILGSFGFTNIIGTVKNYKNYNNKIRVFTISFWSIILFLCAFIIIYFFNKYQFAVYFTYIVSFIMAIKADYSADMKNTEKTYIKYKNFSPEQICNIIMLSVDEMFKNPETQKFVNDLESVAFSFSCFEAIYVLCTNPSDDMLRSITAYLLDNVENDSFFEYRIKSTDKIMGNILPYNKKLSFTDVIEVLSELSQNYYSSKGINVHKYFFFDKFNKFAQQLIESK